MEKYRGIKLGEFSNEKENFCFSLQTGELFVRHSESSIRRLVKDLGLLGTVIRRDKYYWSVGQHLTQTWSFTPRYK